jgi:hypothetical protein
MTAIINTDLQIDFVPGGVMPVLHVPEDEEGHERTFTFHLLNNGVSVTIPAGNNAYFVSRDTGGVAHFTPLTFNEDRNAVILESHAYWTGTPGISYAAIWFADSPQSSPYLITEKMMIVADKSVMRM